MKDYVYNTHLNFRTCCSEKKVSYTRVNKVHSPITQKLKLDKIYVTHISVVLEPKVKSRLEKGRKMSLGHAK